MPGALVGQPHRRAHRVAEEQAEHIVAQGVAHDLESNVRYSFDAKRRITDRDGNRYNADMIATTGNAACAIALRNAILRTVPRALWGPIYDQTRQVIGGKQKPKNAAETAEVVEKRTKALDFLRERYNLSEGQVCRILKVGGTDQIGADQIVILRGLATALQDGEITVDQALRGSKPIPSMPKPKRGKKAKTHRAPKGCQAAGRQATARATASAQPAAETRWPGQTCAATGKTITTDQYRDLMIWLGEHGMDATDAAKVARSLGHAGSVRDLPATLWPSFFDALEKKGGRS